MTLFLFTWSLSYSIEKLNWWGEQGSSLSELLSSFGGVGGNAKSKASSSSAYSSTANVTVAGFDSCCCWDSVNSSWYRNKHQRKENIYYIYFTFHFT